MVNRLLFRKLWRDLWHRKGALLALLIIVAIGVGVYVSMAGVYRDLDGSRSRYYRAQRLADFYVDLKRAPEWVTDRVAAMPNVRSVRGRVFFGVRIDLPRLDVPVTGTAISMPVKPVPVLNDVLLRSGSWFSHQDSEEVVLNDAFARENDLRPGTRIKVMLMDKQHDLLVVGTAMSPEFVYLIPADGGMAPDPARFGVMYMPERFLQEACDLDGAYNQLIGLVHDNSDVAVDNTLTLIEESLDAYGVTNTAAARDHPSTRFLHDELRGLKINSTVMPTIFLGVAALVLNVLIGRMVVQQRTIIGTLMALGYPTGSILRHYLSFGAIIGTLGGTTGIILGVYLETVFVKMYRTFFALPEINAHLYPEILATGMAISVLFALAGTVKGVRVAAALQPAEAMRPPPPEKGVHVLPERILPLWRRLPFRWKMITRAVFRNPFRSMVSVLACSVSTALVFTAVSMMATLDYMMGYEFEKVSHQDFTVSLRDPAGRHGPPEIESLPATSFTEPQLAVVCDISNGPYRKRLGVTGLPSGNRLYTPLDKQGRPIGIPTAGLVLAKKVAEILNVQPGDTVRLRPLIARRQEVTAPVVATVDTFFGLSAYADINYLSRLLGEEWSANLILGRWFRGSYKVPFLAKLKERPTVVGISERTRALTQLDEAFGELMGASMGIMVLFAGLIAFGSVLNAALVSLSERRREVGTLRVIGYSTLDTTRIFSGESYLLNVAGIATGLAGGIGLFHLLARAYDTELYRWPVIVYPSRLFLTAILMIVFISAAQLIIYRIIRNMDWLNVMKVKE
jgi:putative ABC transport system permease protein